MNFYSQEYMLWKTYRAVCRREIKLLSAMFLKIRVFSQTDLIGVDEVDRNSTKTRRYMGLGECYRRLEPLCGSHLSKSHGLQRRVAYKRF